jgi:hypothetical protein
MGWSATSCRSVEAPRAESAEKVESFRSEKLESSSSEMEHCFSAVHQFYKNSNCLLSK